MGLSHGMGLITVILLQGCGQYRQGFGGVCLTDLGLTVQSHTTTRGA